MKIGIIGPGAMGCFLAARLALSGNDLMILDHNPERAEFMNKKGLKIKEDEGPYPVMVPVTLKAGDLAGCELLINCVKAYDTRSVAQALQPLGTNPYYLTLQNGVGNVEILGEYLPKEKILAGITAHGATYLGYGRVKYAGPGDTFIGQGFCGLVPNPEGEDRLRAFAEVLTEARIHTRIVERIDDLIWSKLMVNVGINALTAVTRLANGKLIEYPETREILEEAVEEGIRVGAKKGIAFLYEDMPGQVKKVCRNTAANISSMLQDVLKKKKTEIDFINGVIMKTGGELNVPVPVNSLLTRLVKILEASYDCTAQKY
jgi:2-dehydropantoate 2-reductase